MKKFNKRTLGIAALFVAAFVMIGFSGVGAARAAANYQSMRYDTQLSMYDISVTLNENGNAVAKDGTKGTLLTSFIPEGETFKLGKEYSEVLTATNSGTIDQYVRVVLDLYWLDENGNKLTDLKPSYIGMNLNSEGDWISDLAANGWIVDPSSSYLTGNGEQLILYYSQVLASGTSTAPISNLISVDPVVGQSASQTTEGNVVTTKYKYDGVSFGISAEVDAIQTHNAADAALSAWGVNLVFNNGTASLG